MARNTPLKYAQLFKTPSGEWAIITHYDGLSRVSLYPIRGILFKKAPYYGNRVIRFAWTSRLTHHASVPSVRDLTKFTSLIHKW